MEGTVQTIDVSAELQRIYEIAIDLEAYPQWAKGVKSAEVTEVDDQGLSLIHISEPTRPY